MLTAYRIPSRLSMSEKGERKMEGTSKPNERKAGKKKMSGWLIALIVVVVLFAVGAICCNTIGKAHGANPTNPTNQSTTNDRKQ